MTPLERITERVMRLGHPGASETPRPLLTIDEFFDGNFVEGSIGCNLSPTPSPEQFYKLFREISQRPEVKDIRVQITEFDDPDWPFSDTVYVITTVPPDEVMAWFPKELKPDETWEGFSDQSFEKYETPISCQPIACWWD